MQILQQIISDNLLPRKSEIFQFGVIGLSAIVVTVALAFIAIFFLALAFYNWVSLYTTLPLAALATAGITILVYLAIVVFTYVALKSKPKKPGQAEQAEEVSQMMAVAASVAGEEFGKSINSNPKTTLLLAGIAGFAAAKYLKK